MPGTSYALDRGIWRDTYLDGPARHLAFEQVKGVEGGTAEHAGLRSQASVERRDDRGDAACSERGDGDRLRPWLAA